MSHDDHALCGSFCECGPEVTPMSLAERDAYVAEVNRLQVERDHAAAIVDDREYYRPTGTAWPAVPGVTVAYEDVTR